MSESETKPQLALVTPSGQRCGEDRFNLLKAIDQCGTLASAAKQVGLSYKAAWDGVNAMNNLFEKPLVLKIAGGKHGGSCELTPEGHKTLVFHQTFQKALSETLKTLSQTLSETQRKTIPVPSFFGVPILKTTARNTFFGRITALNPGAVNTEVQLEISKDQSLSVIITKQSAEDLGLEIGEQAYALIKASTPILMNGDAGVKTSARNQLSGTIQQVDIGAVNAEIILDLGHGKTLCAIITKYSAQALDLKVGNSVCALIKSSQIILAAA